MIDSHYLAAGLNAMARAPRVNPMSGHLGAAVIAGCFVAKQHPDLDADVYRGIDGELDRIIGGESVFSPKENAAFTAPQMFEPFAETAQAGRQDACGTERPEGLQFDGIVFGERVPRRWMPGSDMFQRTPPPQVQESWPAEAASPDEVVQLAAVYQGKQVTLYRNGAVYATAEVNQPAVFPSGSSVILGLRHMAASAGNSRFHGDVLDARVYGEPLSGEQLAALLPNAEGGPKPGVWFDFANNGLRDRTGAFPEGTLDGSARVDNGSLHVDEDGYFRSLGSVTTLSRLTSSNLTDRTPVPEPFIETDVRNVAMCPHLFKFGGWYYFIGGTQWFRSRNEFGPWTPPEPRHLCDLYVPKTAKFGESRRLYAGFLRDGGWGGNEVLRELVQDKDGWLGTRFVPEMIPACGEEIPVDSKTIHLAPVAGERAEATIPHVPNDCRLELEVVPEPGVRSVGLTLRAGPGDADGCDLACDLTRGTVTYSKRTDSAGRVEPGPAITGVRNLDKPFTLDLICRHDILDAEIARFRATCTRF
ncbi:MAG: hypothetical protein GW911_02170 [Armatimonadetes bacterium]|nr:hypothetical protein [Armatimonadota bacterium]NCO91410.1 hypothetical protein [Armatimonadota bacterium]NCP29654.1 hypothetical protein [Armatimonadota bacterium]NCQ28768.1 hypothetical protein [Armatimonadota bacterium]NDK10847.1 hypothetical protein [Armatimonadota bacterium]